MLLIAFTILFVFSDLSASHIWKYCLIMLL